jgi:hypothetical protein
MQIVRAEIALGGDVRSTVVKEITVPELVVLEAIHGGPASITNVVVVGESRRPHAEELDRLRKRYDKPEDEHGPIVGRLFPGYTPKLPLKLADIGRAEDGDEEAGAEKPKKKKATKKKASKKTAAKPADDASADDERKADGGSGESEDDDGDDAGPLG